MKNALMKQKVFLYRFPQGKRLTLFPGKNLKQNLEILGQALPFSWEM